MRCAVRSRGSARRSFASAVRSASAAGSSHCPLRWCTPSSAAESPPAKTRPTGVHFRQQRINHASTSHCPLSSHNAWNNSKFFLSKLMFDTLQIHWHSFLLYSCHLKANLWPVAATNSLNDNNNNNTLSIKRIFHVSFYRWSGRRLPVIWEHFQYLPLIDRASLSPIANDSTHHAQWSPAKINRDSQESQNTKLSLFVRNITIIAEEQINSRD